MLCCKWQSLRYSPGRSNPHCCVVVLYVGRGQRGNITACSALSWLSVTSSTTHKQIGPFWCWFSGGWWAFVHSRTPWVSPTNSPVNLGVFPAAITPTDFSNQRFWGFISLCWNLSCVVCLAPQLFLAVYLLANVGPPAAALPRILSALAARLCPHTSLNECFFFSSLVVGLPYSLIFWQFWLFFVFKFVVVLLVVWGGKVYLPMPHLVRKS